MMLPNGFAQRCIRLVVKGAGGIVQHQNLRRRCQCPGNQDTLPLTAAEVRAPHYSPVVICILIAFDKFPCHGVSRSPSHLLRPHLSPKGNILLQRIRKDNIILEYHAEQPVKLVLIVSAHIPSVNENMPFVRVIETHQQVDDGSLAAAGGAYNPQGAALFHRKINLLQAFLAFQAVKPCHGRILLQGFLRFRRLRMLPIAECHMVKDDVPLPLCLCRFFRGNGLQFLLAVHYGGNAVGRGICLGHQHENAVQAHNPHQNHIKIGKKRQNHTGLGNTAVHPVSAHDHHNGKPDI